MTVMAQWHGTNQWESQQLLLFAMPALLLGNILDILYQLKWVHPHKHHQGNISAPSWSEPCAVGYLCVV
jgi:hypothetical protein